MQILFFTYFFGAIRAFLGYTNKKEIPSMSSWA